MNYRHAFHAGNHADVLKHLLLLAVCDALTSKPTACFALDTHAGRGLYRLGAEQSQRTREAATGIERLRDADDRLVARYLRAVAACRAEHGPDAYPGSPWLLAHALRTQDRIACCELQPEEAQALRRVFRNRAGVAVHMRDGYAAPRALLPPRAGATGFSRGLVLMDPPYEMQLQDLRLALAALREGCQRWAQGTYLLWYPVKQRRALPAFYRGATALPAQSILRCELLMRADDSPLRMNGSGLLVLNPPWRLEAQLAAALPVLQHAMAEPGGSHRIDWLRAPAE